MVEVSRPPNEDLLMKQSFGFEGFLHLLRWSSISPRAEPGLRRIPNLLAKILHPVLKSYGLREALAAASNTIVRGSLRTMPSGILSVSYAVFQPAHWLRDGKPS